MSLQAITHRLWQELSIHYLWMLFLLSQATWVEVMYRVPSEFLFRLLPVVGIGAVILILVRLMRRFSALNRIEKLNLVMFHAERAATIPVLIFVGHALVVLVNGANDFSRPVEQQYKILSKSTFEVELGSPVLLSWAHVASTQDPNATSYVLLPYFADRALWGGEIVKLHVHAGSLGIPWVSRIERDEEYYLRDALHKAPRSAVTWRNLVVFYKDLKRWDDAVNALHEYLEIYPKAYKFAANIASEMVNEGRLDQAVPLLEYAVEMGEHYDDYQSLGVALQWKGDKKRAVEVFQASIPIAPQDWEAYFHLGETLSQMGRIREAVAMYQKVLERRPDFPEVENRIAGLKRQQLG